MSQGSARKAFKLQQEWDENAAIALNGLLDDLVSKQTVKRTGTYRGTGSIQAVEVSDLPNPPLLLVLQKMDGSTPHITLMPIITGSNVIAWSKKYFTLAAASAFNTAGADYLYLVIA